MIKPKKTKSPSAEDLPANTIILDTPVSPPAITTDELPFETEQLRAELAKFLDQPYTITGRPKMRLGAVKWGVYAFFD